MWSHHVFSYNLSMQFLSLLPALGSTSTAVRSYRTVYGAVPYIRYTRIRIVYGTEQILYCILFKIQNYIQIFVLLSFVFYLLCICFASLFILYF